MSFLAVAEAMARARFVRNTPKGAPVPTQRFEDVEEFAELSQTNKFCARQILELAANYLECNGHHRKGEKPRFRDSHPLAYPTESVEGAIHVVIRHRYGGDAFLVKCAHMRLRERLHIKDIGEWEASSTEAHIIRSLRHAAVVQPDEIEALP